MVAGGRKGQQGLLIRSWAAEPFSRHWEAALPEVLEEACAFSNNRLKERERRVTMRLSLMPQELGLTWGGQLGGQGELQTRLCFAESSVVPSCW